MPSFGDPQIQAKKQKKQRSKEAKQRSKEEKEEDDDGAEGDDADAHVGRGSPILYIYKLPIVRLMRLLVR